MADLEASELEAAIEAFNVRAMDKLPWQAEGHMLIGKRVLRAFGSSKKTSVAKGTVTKWLPADREEVALFRVVHDDGDEEDLEEDECKDAVEAFENLPQRRSCGRFRGPRSG